MSSISALLVDLPWLGVTSFILAAVLAALGCYGVARKLAGLGVAADSELLSRGILARLGTLHALILALMFAQEMADYRDISRVASLQAGAVADVYFTLKEYDREHPESTAAIGDGIVGYVEAVLREDRTQLAATYVDRETWDMYQHIYNQLRGLQPATDIQGEMRAQMLADWDTVSDLRHQFLTAAGSEAPGFFWMVAIFGFFSVIIPCYVYSPKLLNLVTLSVFAAVNGLVMYVIFAIADPFTGPGAIEPTALETMLATMGISPRT